MSSIFDRDDLPIASKMIDLVDEGYAKHPFQIFMCYWLAFNNIYTTNSFTLNQSGELQRDIRGNVEYRQSPLGPQLPIVKKISTERQQIEQIIKELDQDIRNQLIRHESIKFFVQRSLTFNGTEIKEDHLNQYVNGVINIRFTLDKDYPFWSPLDRGLYNKYFKSEASTEDEDLFTTQIVFMLYTIRNNLFHGGKEPTGWNDVQVVCLALPLLELIVRYFIKHY